MRTALKTTLSRTAAVFARLCLFLLLALGVIAARPASADTTPPTITKTSTSPAGGTYPATPLPTVTVTATITDTGSGSTGVNPNSVHTEVYINGGDAAGYAFSNGGSGNVYTGTVPLGYFGSNNSGSSKVFTIVVFASDNAGNQNSKTVGTFTQLNDSTPPTISGSISPGSGTYPATPLPTVTVTATVTDTGGTNTGVNSNSVYAEVYGNGNDEAGYALSNGGSGNVYTGSVPLGYFGSNNSSSSIVYTVVVFATDNAGNKGSKTVGTFTQVNDNTPPAITGSTSPAGGTYPATPLPTVTVTATITDTGGNNTGVNSSSAYIEVYGNGNDENRYALSNGGSGNVYTGTVPLGYGSNNSGSSIVYTVVVFASDNAGNQGSKTVGTFTQVSDTIPPKITNATVTPQFIPNGGETVTLSANVTDSGGNNTGVDPSSVYAEIYEDGSDYNSVGLSHSNGSLYTGTYRIPPGDANPHTWTFQFRAKDNAYNQAAVNRYAEQAGTTTQPAPTLTSISPASGFSNLTGTITLTGTKFTQYSVVLFDGFVVPAHFVSATKLTCSVDKSFLPAAKQVQVQVYNTPPGGGTTNGQTFTIKPRLSMLTLTPKAVTGGSTATATVTLAHAAFADQTVTLASNNTAVATVPASVVIPMGSSSATFTVNTTTVTTPTPVKIKAVLGPTALTATLTVNPASGPVSDSTSTVTTPDDADAPGEE